jgi:hypothetical protein
MPATGHVFLLTNHLLLDRKCSQASIASFDDCRTGCIDFMTANVKR